MWRRIYVTLVITFFTLVLSLAYIMRWPYRGYSAQVVLTSSMAPAIPAGSVVVTKQLAGDQYRVGDVVTFFTGKQSVPEVTHRITGIQTGKNGLREVVTKGDANTNGDDGVVEVTRIKGKVVTGLPLLGYVFTLEKTPTGFLCLILVTFFAFVVMELYHLVAYVQQFTTSLRTIISRKFSK